MSKASETDEFRRKHGKVPCEKCDDTDTVCLACDQGIMDCDCGSDQEPCTCDVCHGGAAEPDDI